MNRGRATRAWFGVLALSLALTLACARTVEQSSRTPMMVIGMDGADWSVIEAMWREGRLPTLRSLANDGSRAVLKTSWASSPVIWTTVATGMVPSVHGITGFVEATPEGDVPVSSTMRRVPALWNITSTLGRRTMVAGWWATWPAETIHGVLVTDRILDPIADTFSPPTFAPEAERGLAAAPAEKVFTGVEVGEERDRAIAWFAKRLAYEDFDLLLAYFRITDLASHHYWHSFANEPALGVAGEEARRDRERLFLSYDGVDRTIAEMMSIPRKRINVIVLSDHGFRTARREMVRVAFDLDRALERLGWLVRDDRGGVDVARSRVYTYGSGHTVANKRVRFGGESAGPEPTPARRAELRSALARDLARLTWPGGAPAARIAEPVARHSRRGADLMVQIETDTAATPLLLDGAPLEGVVESIHRISGSHGASTDGVLIAAGPDIAKGAALDGIHVRDMTPTILYGLDAPVARDFAGQPWRALYTSEFRSRYPLQAIDSWGPREHGEVTKSAVDEKLLEELRALGYLD